jgi:hypothetical protein
MKQHVSMTTGMIRRATALRDAGLSMEAIRAVIELDFGRAPSTSTLRNHIGRPRPTPLGLSCVGNGANLASAS